MGPEDPWIAEVTSDGEMTILSGNSTVFEDYPRDLVVMQDVIIFDIPTRNIPVLAVDGISTISKAQQQHPEFTGGCSKEKLSIIRELMITSSGMISIS